MPRIALFVITAASTLYAAGSSPSRSTRTCCRSCRRTARPAIALAKPRPMSFLTYKDARPWAKAMKSAVALRKMPPWFADPQFGHFLNDRSLKPDEIETIAKWADNGAPEGNAEGRASAGQMARRVANPARHHRARPHVRCPRSPEK